jgi:hypothetical protein
MRHARDALIDQVEASRSRRLSGLLPTLGILLVGALVGGGTSAAIAAVIANGNEPSDPTIAAIPAPQLGDELPGTPLITTVGEIQVFTLTETTSIVIPTPAGATAVRVRLSCHAAGDLVVRGNDTELTCNDVAPDVIAGGGFASGFGFSPLGPDLTIGVTMSDGTVGSLSVQYTREARTPWAINSAGQSYGVAWQGYPDLLAVVGRSAEGVPTVGYVPQWVAVRPTSDQAAEWKHELQEKFPDGQVPLTTGDGRSVIGSYWVDDDANTLWLDELWSRIQGQYPEAERPPAVQLAPAVLPSSWPTAMTTCMVGAGFAEVVVKPDATLEYGARDLAFELAEYSCWASNPLGAHVSTLPVEP